MKTEKKGISQRKDELINSPHTTSVTTGASLSFCAKIPQLFELPKPSAEKKAENAEFMKVWHGSAAVFDHFDSSHFMEGEGIRYIVTTEKKDGKGLFTNFFTNRKPQNQRAFTLTQQGGTQTSSAVSGAKLQNNSVTTKEKTSKNCGSYDEWKGTLVACR